MKGGVIEGMNKDGKLERYEEIKSSMDIENL